LLPAEQNFAQDFRQHDVDHDGVGKLAPLIGTDLEGF